MRDVPHALSKSGRVWKVMAVLVAGATVSGCYSCSLNGGWEGQMNPFCVEKDTLIGPLAWPEGAALGDGLPPRAL